MGWRWRPASGSGWARPGSAWRGPESNSVAEIRQGRAQGRAQAPRGFRFGPGCPVEPHVLSRRGPARAVIKL